MDAFSTSSNITSNCSDFEFSMNDRAAILSILTIVSFLSLVMNVTVISIAVYLRLYKSFAHRLAMYLVLSSIPTNIVHISQLASLHDDDVCKVIGILRQYFLSQEVLFSACFTFHLFCLGVLNLDFKFLEPVYIVVPLFSPLLVIWIPLIKDKYGVTIAWCDIRSLQPCSEEVDSAGLAIQFIIWYGPLFIIQNLNAVAIVSVICTLCYKSRTKLWKHGNGERDSLLVKAKVDKSKNALRELIPLMVYLIIFYVISMIPVAHRFYLIDVKHGTFAFAVLHVISNGLWGLNCSTAQLIHIYVNRKQRIERKRLIRDKAKGNEDSQVIPLAPNQEQQFTSYTEISTFNKTVFVPPTESEVERMMFSNIKL